MLILKLLLQASSYCSPNAFTCYESLSKDNYGCKVSCTGLYADVNADVELEVSDDRARKMLSILANGGENLYMYLYMFTLFI